MKQKPSSQSTYSRPVGFDTSDAWRSVEERTTSPHSSENYSERSSDSSSPSYLFCSREEEGSDNSHTRHSKNRRKQAPQQEPKITRKHTQTNEQTKQPTNQTNQQNNNQKLHKNKPSQRRIQSLTAKSLWWSSILTNSFWKR